MLDSSEVKSEHTICTLDAHASHTIVLSLAFTITLHKEQQGLIATPHNNSEMRSSSFDAKKENMC